MDNLIPVKTAMAMFDQIKFLKKGKLGTWKKSLMLFPGTYEYKYNIDGSWQEDPKNSQKCMNVFGAYNNVITIPE